MTGQHTLPLAGGGALPLVGYGTWRVSGRKGYEAMRLALAAGFRHLDTATFYRNEAEVGRAVRESGLARDEVFITTKVPADRVGRERETLDQSLRALDMSYVDLWLVHWPPGRRELVPMWRALLAARDEGLARAVGVSNFSTAQLDELIGETGQAPAVNQVPWSPWQHDPALLAAARARGVVVEGYSPLQRSRLRDPLLAELAGRYAVTPAQVVLRWHLEHEIVVIPRSVTPEHIRSNLDLFGFSLSPDEVARLDALTS